VEAEVVKSIAPDAPSKRLQLPCFAASERIVGRSDTTLPGARERCTPPTAFRGPAPAHWIVVSQSGCRPLFAGLLSRHGPLTVCWCDGLSSPEILPAPRPAVLQGSNSAPRWIGGPSAFVGLNRSGASQDSRPSPLSTRETVFEASRCDEFLCRHDVALLKQVSMQFIETGRTSSRSMRERAEFHNVFGEKRRAGMLPVEAGDTLEGRTARPMPSCAPAGPLPHDGNEWPCQSRIGKPPDLGHHGAGLGVRHTELLSLHATGFLPSSNRLGQKFHVTILCCHQQPDSSHVIHQAWGV
jgi:hypothetical protein